MATIYNRYRRWCTDQDIKIIRNINTPIPGYTTEGTLNSAAFSFAVNMIYRGNVIPGLQAALLAVSGKIAQFITHMLLNQFRVPGQKLFACGIGTSISPLAGKALLLPVASQETLSLSVLSFITYAWLNQMALPAFPMIVRMKRA
jgi:hypothetical protein